MDEYNLSGCIEEKTLLRNTADPDTKIKGVQRMVERTT